MFSKRHHIKAVTLLELLIVLAVGSVVFASAAKCYEIVFKQTFIIKKVINAVEEVHQLHYILERDVFKATHILKEGERSLHFRNDSLSASYELGEQVILRRQALHTDTFHIPASDIQLGLVAADPGLQLVDRIQFTGLLFEKKENFIFKKTYSAETLLNLSPEETP